MLLGGNAETSGSYCSCCGTSASATAVSSRGRATVRLGLAWRRPAVQHTTVRSIESHNQQSTHFAAMHKHAPCDHKLQPAHSLRWANRRRPRYPNRWTRRRPLARLPV